MTDTLQGDALRDEIYFDSVRCFKALERVQVSPVTILVGENSAGKSTFLALVRLAHDLARGNLRLDFNEEPFFLGAYDQIAHFHGGKGARATSFHIGMETDLRSVPDGSQDADALPLRRKVPRRRERVRLNTEFVPVSGQPQLRRWEVTSGEYGIKVEFSEAESQSRVVLRTPSGEQTGEDLVPTALSNRLWDLDYLIYRISTGRLVRGGDKGISGPELRVLQAIAWTVQSVASRPRPFAIAPIRTKPKRTYDPTLDAPNPGGEHIPVTLANLYGSGSAAWGGLRSALAEFGNSTGLFSDLEIRRLGARKKQGDPFQIHVKMRGQVGTSNLVDVGYGVSQVLPVLVDAVLAKSGSTLLIQQPEVHLHPRAQAELGTFLCRLAKSQNKRFIVETHSDYLIDRARLELKSGVLDPGDLAVHFFDRVPDAHGRRVHPVPVADTDLGELPERYRDFFIDEARRVLLP